MNLNSKFFIGFGILAVVGSGFLFSSFVFGEIPSFYRLLFLGITTTIVGIIFVVLLFSPERIKGYRAEYTVSPDLTQFEVTKSYPDRSPVKPEIPEVAYCSACGKKIYKPFYCSRCGQLLCGEHILPGSHTCKDEV